MQDFGTKADDTAGPSGQLSAAEFNNLATENENAVLRSGQTLTGASVTQLAQSLFLHGVKSQAFQDSGAANAYVATPISGTNGVLLPADYANMNGAVIAFKASASNTAASTLNIGQTTGTLLGTKAIVDQAGAVLPAGSIQVGAYVEVRYDASIGAGSWVLLPWTSLVAAQAPGFLNSKMTVATAAATATWTADSVTLNTALGGKSFQIASFSKTINLATTGAGGMDTGAAPINGYVGLYAIYNPTTGVSALLAVNGTSVILPAIYGGANMPSGFTASVLVTVVPTNGSGQIKICVVRGRNVSIQLVTVLTSTSNVPSSNIPISAAVPLNAISILGELGMASSSASNLSVNIFSDAAIASGQQNVSGAVPAGGNLFGNYSGVMLTTPQSVGVSASTSGAGPTFNAYVGGYSL